MPVRFGLALSGGTAKSIAHIGVLRALEAADLRPDLIVGTSGGSLIGVIYASGVGIERMTEMAAEVNWRRLARVRLPRLGLFSNRGVAELVRSTVGDLRFEDLQIPTCVVATDLLSGEKVVFSEGAVAPAVQASCSIPQIFSPVEIDGGLYVDGGFVEYLPVETLRERGCEVTVGVHLGAYADFTEPPRHLLSLVLRTIGIVGVRNARTSAALADVIVAPDLRGFASFDLGRAHELIDGGHRAGEEAIPLIREAIARAQAVGPPAEDGRWWRRLLGRPTTTTRN
jgi:NTE family protein